MGSGSRNGMWKGMVDRYKGEAWTMKGRMGVGEVGMYSVGGKKRQFSVTNEHKRKKIENKNKN